MLPITLDCANWRILLVGAGSPATRRLALLDAAGCRDVLVFGGAEDMALRAAAGARYRPAMPDAAAMGGARLLFVAGLPVADGSDLARLARQHRVLVNVEDERPDCDFHVPAVVRRGGLLLAISTGGGSPALAARLRAWLEVRFGDEWVGRLERASALRSALRAEGHKDDVTACVNALVDREGWLA